MLSIIEALIRGKGRGLRDKVLLMKKQTLLMNIGLLERNGLNIGFIALGLWPLVSVASRFCVQLKIYKCHSKSREKCYFLLHSHM